jgi:hypothetical protein
VVAVERGSPALEALIRQVQLAHRGVAWTVPWPQGDHYAFTARGVPAVLVSSHGPGAEVMGTPQDTSQQVSPTRLAEAARLVHDIVLAVSQRDPDWSRARA